MSTQSPETYVFYKLFFDTSDSFVYNWDTIICLYDTHEPEQSDW